MFDIFPDETLRNILWQDALTQADSKEFSDALAVARQKIQAQLRQNNNSQTSPLISAINASVVPIDSFWFLTGILGMGTLGAAALPITLTVFALCILVGGYRFYDAQHKKQTHIASALAEIEFLQLKLFILDELITRKNKTIANLSTQALQNTNLHPVVKPVLSPLKKTKSILLGATVASTLFVGYAIAIPSLLEMLGYLTLLSFIAGPAGIGIAAAALAVAATVGIYVGYKHYQARQSAQLFNQHENYLKTQLAQKQFHYQELTAKESNLNFQRLQNDKSPENNASKLAADKEKISTSPASLAKQPHLFNQRQPTATEKINTARPRSLSFGTPRA